MGEFLEDFIAAVCVFFIPFAFGVIGSVLQ